MKYFAKINHNSISFRLTYYVLLLIFVQTLILIVTLVFGGLMKEIKSNSFQTFDGNVAHQKDYLLKDMNNRWSLVPPFIESITSTITLHNGQPTEDLLQNVAPTLISLLRTTASNGAFLILEEHNGHPNEREAIYFRDYDAFLNDHNNADLYCVVGPAETCISMKIPLDGYWSYNLKLTNDNRAFYDIPADNSFLKMQPQYLGYWSKPFQLTPSDVPIITYSMPIYDQQNQFKGILGVEILVEEFISMLPGTDLLARDSISYLIGYQDSIENGIYPIITNGALQNRILQTNEAFNLQTVENQATIFKVLNHKLSEDLYASVQPIDFYLPNTPYENENWYLIGIMPENKLLGFLNKITNIIAISLIISLLFGAVTSFFVSKEFTNPIVKLAKQVNSSQPKSLQPLLRTGLTEIDYLAATIERANKNLLESTTRLSKIINLVNIPIAAFEIQEDDTQVFATEKLVDLLMIPEQIVENLMGNKEAFFKYLYNIMQNIETDELDVYKLSSSPEKWVRITIFEDGKNTLGTIIDVTAEMLEKLHIKQERDKDALTKLYNRGAYKRLVLDQIQSESLGVSAIIMFDLDFLKVVNDTFGHKWGDFYITKTAESFDIFKEANGIVSRISGDEFSVFLYGFDSKQEIRKLVNAYYDNLDRTPLAFPNENRNINISGGLYWLEENEELSYDEMIQKADEVLYTAKRQGKGHLLEYTAQSLIN